MAERALTVTRPLRIVVDSNDFRFLTQNAMRWAGNEWEAQITAGRFETTTGGHPGTHWKMAYWFSDYPAVILARSFLDSQGFHYETAGDNAGNYVAGDWVILTDYDPGSNR